MSFRYTNIGRSRHLRFEARGELQRQKWAVQASYVLSRVVPREPGARGMQLKNIPRHVLRAGLRASLPFGARGHLTAARAFDRYADDANRVRLRDAVVIDARLSRAFRRFRVHLDVLNGFGARYDPLGFVLADFTGGAVPYVFPAPGFAARLGASLEL